jgi:hypothetical protein
MKYIPYIGLVLFLTFVYTLAYALCKTASKCSREEEREIN